MTTNTPLELALDRENSQLKRKISETVKEIRLIKIELRRKDISEVLKESLIKVFDALKQMLEA